MSITPFPVSSFSVVKSAADAIEDHRQRRELEEKERNRLRTLRYEELRSELNTTAVRVQAWEKLHGLRLPTSSSHPVLRVISAATGIPIAALREEQQARREAHLRQPMKSSAGISVPPELPPGASAPK